jgi:hypothetical protein
MKTEKERKKTNMWYWIIGIIIVIALIWWWVEAADNEVAEPAVREMEDVGSRYFQQAPENNPGVLVFTVFERV